MKRVNFDLPKVSKKYLLQTAQSQQNDRFENQYISTQGEARNIKFGQQVNIIERISFGTPPQEVVMLLAYNHMTNYKGATFVKFGQ